MSQIICLDASFIIRYLTTLETESNYEQYWRQWKTKGDSLVAPTLAKRAENPTTTIFDLVAR